MTAPSERRVDVAIAGASFAGMAFALALARTLGPEVSIALVDRAPASLPDTGDDPRASAISASSQRMLDALGLWPALAPDAEPVRRIEITDSSLEAGVRPVLLTYDTALDDGGWASFIVPNRVLAAALVDATAREPGIARIADAVTGYTAEATGVRLSLAAGSSLGARLVVAADGRRSALREAAGIKVVGWDYPQAGIVTTVGHERPHHGVATQHFLPAGPFAILPLKADTSCITWTEDAARAGVIIELDDDRFLAEVDRRFGGRLGRLRLAGGRRTWPLGMHLARSYIAPRLALVGDAAHGVHPIAGQGLNIALRDVAALAECVAEAARAGFDLGEATALERYERWRRFDATLSASAFDALNRLFSSDGTLLRSTRELGLGIVDRLPVLKRTLVGEAAGLTGELPRLLTGRPV